MKFQQFLIQEDIIQLLEIGEFTSNTFLNEGIGDWTNKMKNILPSLGLTIQKTGPGFLGKLANITENLAEFLYWAFRATMGDKAAAERAKEMSKSIKKEDVLDFLFQLDGVVLHFFTGPIKTIDKLTGWKLSPNIKKATDPIIKKAKNAIDNLETLIKNTSGNIKITLKGYMDRLKALFGLGLEQKHLRKKELKAVT